MSHRGIVPSGRLKQAFCRLMQYALVVGGSRRKHERVVGTKHDVGTVSILVLIIMRVASDTAAKQ